MIWVPVVAFALTAAVVSGFAWANRAAFAPAEKVFMLGGERFFFEDWRVTGKRKGHLLTSYCVTQAEAIDASRHMTATGYRGVKIRRSR